MGFLFIAPYTTSLTLKIHSSFDSPNDTLRKLDSAVDFAEGGGLLAANSDVRASVCVLTVANR
jgi:hypothetical protein